MQIALHCFTEKGQREEDVMIHQHRQELKAMRLELREKEELFEESIEQMEVQLQVCYIRFKRTLLALDRHHSSRS